VELSFDVARSPSLPRRPAARMLARLEGRLVDGVITVAASEHRAQLANRRAARDRLAALLTEAAARLRGSGAPTQASPRGQAAAARREEAPLADQAGRARGRWD
jgi:ribosome-associated protein